MVEKLFKQPPGDWGSRKELTKGVTRDNIAYKRKVFTKPSADEAGHAFVAIVNFFELEDKHKQPSKPKPKTRGERWKESRDKNLEEEEARKYGMGSGPEWEESPNAPDDKPKRQRGNRDKKPPTTPQEAEKRESKEPPKPTPAQLNKMAAEKIIKEFGDQGTLYSSTAKLPGLSVPAAQMLHLLYKNKGLRFNFKKSGETHVFSIGGIAAESPPAAMRMRRGKKARCKKPLRKLPKPTLFKKSSKKTAHKKRGR